MRTIIPLTLLAVCMSYATASGTNTQPRYNVKDPSLVRTANKKTICGCLVWLRKEGDWHVYRGTKIGRVTVVFSKNGVVTGMIHQNVWPGQFYRFRQPVGGTVGISCRR